MTKTSETFTVDEIKVLMAVHPKFYIKKRFMVSTTNINQHLTTLDISRIGRYPNWVDISGISLDYCCLTINGYFVEKICNDRSKNPNHLYVKDVTIRIVDETN